MKILLMHTSFKLIFLVVLASLLNGCSITKKHEQEAQIKADKVGLIAIEKTRFDAVYIAPGAQFSQYKKLLVGQLDLGDVKILKPSTSRLADDTPWELSDNDRCYYQERYNDALMNNLIASGVYATATQVGVDVMTLSAKVIEIAPLASKDDINGRPTQMKVYSEGMGTMTIEISLNDSVSGKPVAIITDQRDLGQLWEENNRMTNNIQVRHAFNHWLSHLRTELDKLSGR